MKLGHLGPAATNVPTFRLLLCHATGFCKEMWDPFVEDLGKLFSQNPTHFSASIAALDFSAHGDSRPAADPAAWGQFTVTDIAEAVACFPPSSSRAPLVGVGHSMGGAGLCHAALAHPGQFARLVLFEPVLPSYSDPALKAFTEAGKALSSIATRRRGTWPSIAEARAYFRSRPLMASWDPRSIEAYVTGALRTTASGVELKCAPLVEAAVYTRPPDITANLAAITAPVHLLAGRTSGMFPTSQWEHLAATFANSRLEMVDGSHFWPFEKPAALASLVYANLTTLSSKL